MTEESTPGVLGSNAGLGPLPKHDHAFADPEGDEPDILVWRAESVRAYAAAAVAADRVRIAACLREAWHQREASHGNRAGEYHEGMLAGLDAAVALALGPNVGTVGRPKAVPHE